MAGGGYLKHVVNDVELDDGLAPDEVVHHGVVHVAHHAVAQHHDEALQHVAHLRRLQQARATACTHTHTKQAHGQTQVHTDTHTHTHTHKL